MVNLLKNNNFKNLKEPNLSKETKDKNAESIEKDIPPLKFTKAKTDISRYHDLEGLSVGKLEIGLWFVKNKELFKRIFIGLLILVSTITWVLFFYTYGHYIFIGMNQDKELANTLVKTGSIDHNIVMAQAAQSMIISSLEILNTDNNFDFYLTINNPNVTHYGSFSYYFLVKGEAIGHGTGFILPNEKKYLVSLNHSFDSRPQDVQFVINENNWARISRRDYANWDVFVDEHMQFLITEKVFTPAYETILSEKININKLAFDIKNQSVYNYQDVNLNILLFDKNRIIGVTNYALVDIMSGEKRGIDFSWPGNFSRVSKIEIIPEVDIIDKEIYLNFTSQHNEIK